MRFIKYIGSKRKLITHVLEAIGSRSKVLDLFSGSGVVAYNLRSQGAIVHANDTAAYSFHINKTYLESDEVPEEVFSTLNLCKIPKIEYFAKYYSQGSPRLFYTRENGLIIDAILEQIWSDSFSQYKSQVLCDLLYRMSVHSNTSGLFKSFHKKFAGNERFEGLGLRRYNYAKKQVLTPIQLDRPVLPIGPKGKAFQYEASKFFDVVDDTYDVIYLDPPYNVHQYSGSYHLLEQACRPLEERYIPTDDQISGIQPDLYKSPYCSRKTCLKTLASLLDKLIGRTKKVVISYNSNGYISKEAMTNLLNDKFRNTEIKEINYYNFTGGPKQSEKSVQEFIFISEVKCI